MGLARGSTASASAIAMAAMSILTGLLVREAWWRHPIMAVRMVPRHSRRHVAWCAAHHPNYNPRTNNWIGRWSRPPRIAPWRPA